jgi:hypothetical protein
MKKLLIFSNLFWLCVITFNACIKVPQEVKTNDCKTVCYNYSNEQFPGINYLSAKTFIDNYVNSITVNTSTGPQVDLTQTQSVWLSLRKMKTFLYQIEKNSCAMKNCDVMNGDSLGVRVYFGKYPTAPITSNPYFEILNTSPNLAGRTTLLFVPTYRDNTGLNIDFDPDYAANRFESCNPKTISSIKQDKEMLVSTSPLLKILTPEEGHGMANRGNVCPPYNCPPPSF